VYIKNKRLENRVLRVSNPVSDARRAPPNRENQFIRGWFSWRGNPARLRGVGFFAFLWASPCGSPWSVVSGKGFILYILDFLASNLQPLTFNVHRLSLRPTKMDWPLPTLPKPSRPDFLLRSPKKTKTS